MIDEIDERIAAVLSPMGGLADKNHKDIAVSYLTMHADAAYPRLLHLLETRPKSFDAPAIIEILPLFGRPDAIPVLERILLTGDEFTARAAGQALGRFADPRAERALTRALLSSSNETLIGAADGLLTRDKPTDCSLLNKLIQHPNDTVRYHAIRAAGKLKCLSQSDLATLSHDTDNSIRQLVVRLTENHLD